MLPFRCLELDRRGKRGASMGLPDRARIESGGDSGERLSPFLTCGFGRSGRIPVQSLLGG